MGHSVLKKYSYSLDYILTRSCLNRGVYPPAEEYMTYAERPNESLVEAFKSMNMEEEIPSENGDPAHEVVHLVVMLDSLVA